MLNAAAFTLTIVNLKLRSNHMNFDAENDGIFRYHLILAGFLKFFLDCK